MRKLRHLLLVAVGLLWFFSASAATHARTTVQKLHRTRQQRWVGLASWYGKRHQGKRMTNGKRFDRRALTAASRSLPLGTNIRVFNLENGKFVDVTVTDRGPARRDRILDMSEAAARQLDFTGRGVTRVFFFILPQPEVVDFNWTIPPLGGNTPAVGAAGAED